MLDEPLEVFFIIFYFLHTQSDKRNRPVGRKENI